MATDLRMLITLSLLMAASSAGQTTSGNPKIDQILERLETAGQTVKDLRCEVAYTQFNPLIEDKVVKTGEIFFVNDKPNSRFLVRFDKTVQEGTVDRNKEWHIFDGRWYVEARQSTKQVIRREVVPEGEEIDPFDVSKGPFPLPFGQIKNEILKSFIVRLFPAKANDPANTDHLVLKPIKGTEMADRYKKVEFWIDRELELPVKIFAVNADDEKELTAEFKKIKRNSSFGRSVFDPREIKDWSVHTESFEKK